MIMAAWLIALLVQLPYVAAEHMYSFHPGKIDGKEPFFITLISTGVFPDSSCKLLPLSYIFLHDAELFGVNTLIFYT